MPFSLLFFHVFQIFNQWVFLLNEHLNLGKQEPQEEYFLHLPKCFLTEFPKVQGPSWDLRSKLSPDYTYHCHQPTPTQKTDQYPSLRSSSTGTGNGTKNLGPNNTQLEDQA